MLELDTESVLFGAATHDIGKAICTEELVAPGNSHEQRGANLLERLGVSPERSRFALSHGQWKDDPAMTLDDLLVALADNCWKGKRVPELERRTVDAISAAAGKAQWEVFAAMDDLLQDLAADADERLAWQAQFPTKLTGTLHQHETQQD
jgi:hypothetical protein